MPRKKPAKLVQAGLFTPAEGGPDDDDGKLPVSQERKCGRCREPFWSEVRSARPIFVPMFCARCGRVLALGMRLRRRDSATLARRSA